MSEMELLGGEGPFGARGGQEGARPPRGFGAGREVVKTVWE
ncbi:hypothetical protein [Streptomyces sp. SLBN-8D4]